MNIWRYRHPFGNPNLPFPWLQSLSTYRKAKSENFSPRHLQFIKLSSLIHPFCVFYLSYIFQFSIACLLLLYQDGSLVGNISDSRGDFDGKVCDPSKNCPLTWKQDQNNFTECHCQIQDWKSRFRYWLWDFCQGIVDWWYRMIVMRSEIDCLATNSIIWNLN